ncbi:hypothetical protein F506_04255 [Herbaspirillum hiltneri N3]|uniref:Iron-regulated membrane protein n=1 Tax=Herbaspirillum hiltneri N3 TaxID=1262470 RepID=A0ABM5UXS6_9BURK|nr:PepSY-associated TM helix domain-containing protein [Herbaspirillum hiltneri]AKZ61987.1 hypothetical protein F506_04255 [Herbaspirillum hiltneri N3]
MKLFSARQGALLLHRYVGLVIAGFLTLAGLTGSALAWNDELEAWLAPRLFRVAAPTPGAVLLDGLQLRRIILSRLPAADITHTPLRSMPARSVTFRVKGRVSPVTGERAVLDFDEVMINPYTGEILGTRKWGRPSWSAESIMPFIYRLHQSMAMGVVGTYLFGFIALLWTVDCLVGLFLTLPPPPKRVARKPWLARWTPAWKIRQDARGYKLHFDLHRAAALWFWVLLLLLAWSSVAFNLSEVYDPVMKKLFGAQSEEALLSRPSLRNMVPALDWEKARARGRVLMSALADRHNFTIQREDMLAYDSGLGIYRYDVRSSLDLRQRAGSTQVYFDAGTGAQLAVWLPTGGAPGDTIRTWITSIHMAAIWSWPLKILISLAGIIVAMLSATGVLIWWRRYRARRETRLLHFSSLEQE